MSGLFGRIQYDPVSGSALADDVMLSIQGKLEFFAARKPTNYNISLSLGGTVSTGVYTVKMKTVGGTLETLKDDTGSDMTITLTSIRTVKVLDADVEYFVLSPTTAITGTVPTVTVTIAGF